MGNDHSSHLPGIEIEQKSIEVGDFWSHHSASLITSGNITNLTVLISELFVDGPLWTTRTPLEKNSKNLMIYRHPCIVKYISSWQQNSKYYLAVEDVIPLSHILATQNTLQICIGLHSILKALCFLHEKAQVSHNNICIASIYVSKDSNWKLGSLEYLCRFTDVTSDYLKKSKINRYNKAIDTNEEGNLTKSSRRDYIDIYAFGVLVCEVLKGKTDDEIPSLTNFRVLCKNDLQNVNPTLRPKLHDLLQHEFFNHDFITIHSFLVELPLHSDEEKMQFFQNLTQRLAAFSETTIASQLGSLLLSRMVLLNKTAQDELLPSILCPRLGDNSDSVRLFSEETFKKYLVPKLLEIFCVRDAQIRLLLLNYFPQFMHTFSKEELQSGVLPELLVGVKDTNDHLVAVTLRTLADLVPILGAATVIGGKRAKLFNDGRPIIHPNRNKSNPTKKHTTTTQHHQEIVDNTTVVSPMVNLPERPRPDGEEGETSTEEIEQSVEEDLDNWEDWDLDSSAVNNHAIVNDNRIINNESAVELQTELTPAVDSVSSVPTILRTTTTTTQMKKLIPDIAELDIKNQTTVENSDEIDFFQDMEPVIEAASKYLIVEDDKLKNLGVIEDTNEDGWVDEEW